MQPQQMELHPKSVTGCERSVREKEPCQHSQVEASNASAEDPNRLGNDWNQRRGRSSQAMMVKNTPLSGLRSAHFPPASCQRLVNQNKADNHRPDDIAGAKHVSNSVRPHSTAIVDRPARNRVRYIIGCGKGSYWPRNLFEGVMVSIRPNYNGGRNTMVFPSA